LYFHHAWSSGDRHAANPFGLIKDHVLLKYAGALAEVNAGMATRIAADTLADIVRLIPDPWLADDPGFSSKDAQRQAYYDFFVERLQSSAVFVEEAIRARSSHL
jgi:hypothetical protein